MGADQNAFGRKLDRPTTKQSEQRKVWCSINTSMLFGYLASSNIQFMCLLRQNVDNTCLKQYDICIL